MTKYIKNPKFRMRKEKGGVLVFIPSSGPYWLNDTALDIFDLVTSGVDGDSIVSGLMSKYEGLNIDEVRKDVGKTINILESIGCIRRL